MDGYLEKTSTVLSINPKLYPLETIYSAAYVFLDRAYIQLDGDPEKEVLVKLKLKEYGDIEKLQGDFLNELINYADYKNRAEQTKKIREMLLQRAIITNDPCVLDEKEDKKGEFENVKIPWEEGGKPEAVSRENPKVRGSDAKVPSIEELRKRKSIR